MYNRILTLCITESFKSGGASKDTLAMASEQGYRCQWVFMNTIIDEANLPKAH